MDFLNKAYAQLNELLRSMTPAARLAAGLLVAVVVASLGYLVINPSSGASVDLMNGMPIPAGQLAQMESAFSKKGLTSYEVRGTRILVPQAQKHAYMAALTDAEALPPDFGSSLRNALGNGNVFESDKQREWRIKGALQDELALIIGSMNGIERASVLYNTETTQGFPRTKVTTGTVSVKPTGSKTLDDAQARAIRHLVASAIGAKPEGVTVVDLNGGCVTGGEGDGGDPLGDPYIARKRAYEQQWTEKILGALCYVPGVRVTCNVELDRQLHNRRKSIQRGTPNARPQTDNETSSEATADAEAEDSGPRGEQPTQAANRPAVLVADGAEPWAQLQDASGRPLETMAGQQVETETVGLTPTVVKVSVSVPESYFLKVWSDRNRTLGKPASASPDMAALDEIRRAESAKIEKLVAALLPPVEGVAQAAELVAVTSFPDIAPPETPAPPGWDQRALVWLGQSWSSLAVVLLAAAGLLILRSRLRVQPLPTERIEPQAAPVSHGKQPQRQAAAETIDFAPKIPQQEPPGLELDNRLAERLSTPRADDDAPQRPVNAEPFGFLHETECQKLARALDDERPQTIALVLSYLPAAQAAGVLGRLEADRQTEVIRRLVALEEPDPEVLREVEGVLQTRLAQQVASGRWTSGLAAAAHILNAADPATGARILDNLAANDGPLAARLGARVTRPAIPRPAGELRFADLEGWDDAALAAVFEAADPEVALTALVGAPSAMVQRLLGQLPDARARQIRRRLDNPGPLRLRDVEQAQQEIATLASAMVPPGDPEAVREVHAVAS